MFKMKTVGFINYEATYLDNVIHNYNFNFSFFIISKESIVRVPVSVAHNSITLLLKCQRGNV